MRKILFCILCCIAFQFTVAQDMQSMRRIYDRIVLYREGQVFKVQNEKFKFNQLEKHFANSELGLFSYKKARSNRTVSTVFRLLSIAALYGVVNAASNGNSNQVYLFSAFQLGLTLGGAYFYSLSNKHMDRAILIRNKDYLYPVK